MGDHLTLMEKELKTPPLLKKKGDDPSQKIFDVENTIEDLITIDAEDYEFEPTIPSEDYFKDADETPVRKSNRNKSINKSILNKASTQFISNAIKPRNTNINEEYFPPKDHQTSLLKQNNSPAGDKFQKDHTSFRIMTINMNTLLMHNEFAELHKLCISSKEYNVVTACF